MSGAAVTGGPAGPAGDGLDWPDHRAVVGLLHAYAYHFDRNEPEAVAALFTADAVIDYGPEIEPIRGREAIAPRIAVGLRELFAATSHHISNEVVRRSGPDAAELVAYLHAWHRYRDGAPDGWLWGQYHCKAVRTHEEGWRLAVLRLHGAGTIDFHRATMHPIGRVDA